MEHTNEGQHKWYIIQDTVPAILNRNVIRFGHRTFQLWREGSTVKTATWGEVGIIAAELAAGLMEMGFSKGDRAAIMCNTSPAWIRCDYAILGAGGITVCVYPTLSGEEMTYILNDSGTSFLFVEGTEQLTKALQARKDLSTLKKIIVMNDTFKSDEPFVMNLAEVRKLGVAHLARDPFSYEKRWRSVDLFDPMTIVYTSGTTDRPKGAVHTHYSYNAGSCRDHSVLTSWSDDDLLLSFLPLSHTYERECGHGCALVCAGMIAYSSPKTLVEDFSIFKPTAFMSVPRIYERIYMAMKEQTAGSAIKSFLFNAAMNTGIAVIDKKSDADGFIDMTEGRDFTEGLGLFLKLRYRFFDKLIFSKVREKMGGRIRFAMSAAGSLPADLCKAFLAMGVRVMEGYGATETMNAVNVNLMGRILPGSIGPLNRNCQGKVAEDGEWLVKGPCIFKEYWNNPAATKAAFTPDGYYRTGDIVEVLPAGYIKIVDRKGGLMVLDTGKNVSSGKIESKFSLSPWIDIVVPVGSERKYVTALVVPDFNTFIKHFEASGISYDKSALEFDTEGAEPVCVRVGDDFLAIPELQEIVKKEIDKVNQDELEEYEAIKRYTLLNYKMTEKTGEMTPTLKVKRKIVINNFKTQIDRMYE